MQDWGSSLLLAQALGDRASCLVDLGHHLPNTNVELIVARFVTAGKLGGFHFNDSKYGDDDLTAGSIKPYQLFLVFNEFVDAAAEDDAFDPAYMIDQSHNLKDPIEAMIQTVDNLQRAYAKALLVRRDVLSDCQEGNDVLMAEQTLKEAYESDVSALVAEVRQRAGGALDPISAFRASGYRDVEDGRAGRRRLRPSAESVMSGRVILRTSERARVVAGERASSRSSPSSPMSLSTYLAFDLGASSGRAVLGTLDDGRMAMDEVHRFPTPVVEDDGHLFWDLDALWEDLQIGLQKALVVAPCLRSLSVDSWAVDYVPLDADGASIRRPYAYRDARTDGVMEHAFETLSRSALFARTGIQFLPFNTLYQLLADQRDDPDGLGRVATHLLIADYFNYRFSGRQAIERTNASTTQLMNARTGEWDAELFDAFGLDIRQWPEIVAAGTTPRLGPAGARGGRRGVVLARHRQRRRGGSSHERRLGVRQLRDVVAAGGRRTRADPDRRRPRGRLHERSRRGRDRPLSRRI